MKSVDVLQRRQQCKDEIYWHILELMSIKNTKYFVLLIIIKYAAWDKQFYKFKRGRVNKNMPLAIEEKNG